MPKPLTPEELTTLLREPLEPSHGMWIIYRRLFDGLAMLVEQNERIIELLGPTTEQKK